MCVFFGWQHGTKVVRRYIHLSEKDLDNTLLTISEEGKQVTKQNICSRQENVVDARKH